MRRPNFLRGRIIGGGLTAAVVLLLLGSPAVDARPAILVKPPLTGATSGVSNSTLRNTHCKNESLLVLPSADLASGALKAESHVAASKVTAGSAGCVASVTTIEWFEGPAFLVHASASYKVVYKWQISWNVTYTCTGLLVPCTNATSGTVRLFGNVYDNTTGHWVLPANAERTVFHTSYPYITSGAGNWSVRVAFSASLNSADRYLLYTGLETVGTARSGCSSAGCFYSSMTVDVGDHPMPLVYDGAWLVSMSVT